MKSVSLKGKKFPIQIEQTRETSQREIGEKAAEDQQTMKEESRYEFC